MSGKLDQSLDDILSTQRKSGAGRRGRGRRAATAAGRVTKAAPAGGIQKNTKGASKASALKVPQASSGDTKIIVSNLVSQFVLPSNSALAYISSPPM